MWPLVLVLLAQPANAWLDQARARADALDFAGAIERLEVARQVPGLGRAQRRDLLGLLARCLVAEGRRADAEATWAELLKDEPGYELDRQATSPKILEAFDAAKLRLYPKDWVSLEPQDAPSGRAAFRLVDPWHRVTRVQLAQRVGGAPWRVDELHAEEALVSFPVAVAAGATLEWYLEALAGADVVAQRGTAALPNVVTVPALVAPGGPPVPNRLRPALGWTLLALGLVAGAVGTWLQVTGWNLRLAARQPARPPGDNAATARAAEVDGLGRTTWALGLFIGGGAVALTGTGVLVW